MYDRQNTDRLMEYYFKVGCCEKARYKIYSNSGMCMIGTAIQGLHEHGITEIYVVVGCKLWQEII